VLHVVRIDVRHTLRDLRPGYVSVQVEHLLPDLLHQLGTGLQGQQFVVERVSASDDLNIVNVVTVDSGQTNATVVHLSGENFISVEPIAENARIRVRTVQALLSGDIREVS